MTRYPLSGALVVSLVAGTVVAVLVNKAVDPLGRWPDEVSDLLGIWSLFFGVLAAGISFGIASAGLSHKARTRSPVSPAATKRTRIALLVAASLTGLVGLVVVAWNISWGVPLTSLEGAWLWPTGVVPLLGSYLMVRRARHLARYSKADVED